MGSVGAGTILKQWRAAAGYSQQSFATELGVAVATVSNWETGKVSPRRNDAQRVDALLKAGGQLMTAWGFVTPNDEVAELTQRTSDLQHTIDILLDAVQGHQKHLERLERRVKQLEGRRAAG